MTNITIKDIAKITPWKDVKKALKYFYPKTHLDAFELDYEALKRYRNRTPEDSKEKLVLKVGGFINLDAEDDDNWYNFSTNEYSLSFRQWRELASIPISKETLEHYLFKDILAHYIWEITWYGNESKTNKTKKKVFKSMKEATKDLNEKESTKNTRNN